MDDDARERQSGNHGSRNEKHTRLLLAWVLAAAEQPIIFPLVDDFSAIEPVAISFGEFVQSFHRLRIVFCQLACCLQHLFRALPVRAVSCNGKFTGKRTCKTGGGVRKGAFLPLFLGDGYESVVVFACKDNPFVISLGDEGQVGHFRIGRGCLMHQSGSLNLLALLVRQFACLFSFNEGALGTLPETLDFLELRFVAILKVPAIMPLKRLVRAVEVATKESRLSRKKNRFVRAGSYAQSFLQMGQSLTVLSLGGEVLSDVHFAAGMKIFPPMC